MKRIVTIFCILLLAVSVSARQARCEFYQVNAKRITCYKDTTLKEKTPVGFVKGDIIEVSYAFDEPVNGKTLWRGWKYVPDSLQNEWSKANKGSDYKLSKGRVVGKDSHYVGGYFEWKEDQLTPIPAPDKEAQKHVNLDKWDRFWTPFYEPVLIALFLLCVLLLLVSLFHLKLIRPLVVGALSVFGALFFYGNNGDSYIALVLFPTAVFMPFSFGALLLTFGHKYERKYYAIMTIVGIAALFSYILSLIYLHIVWGGWVWPVLVAFIPAILTSGFVGRAGSMRTGEPCKRCGYYGRQSVLERKYLGSDTDRSVQTTEYRRVSDHSLHHKDIETTDTTHDHYHVVAHCRKCGYNYEYNTSTVSTVKHKETRNNNF